MVSVKTFRPAKVYLKYPNRQTVTFQARNPVTAAITVKDVPQLPYDQQQIGEIDESERIVFLLPKENMSGRVPVAGDWITWGTRVWTILSMRTYMIGEIYRCTCVEQ